MDLTLLPDLPGFRRLTLALAALDTVMCGDWELRYYSFTPDWGEGEEMASMRNGSGDQWFALSCAAGTALVGLAHESPTYTPGTPKAWVFRDLPPAFEANVRREPAFEADDSTFCVWRLAADDEWRCGLRADEHERAREDGARELLSILAGDPQQYADFARDYYEREVDVADVACVYGLEPVTRALARRLNPDVDWDAARDELVAMGVEVG